MESWMRIKLPMTWSNRWIANYKGIFDAWEDGGVRGLAVGRLLCELDDGSYVPAFSSDRKIYERYGIQPTDHTACDPEKEKILHEILDNAANRGWTIMLFDVPGRSDGPFAQEDPFGETSLAAAMQDALKAFPQASGVIMDGGGEQPYELAWHHGSELLALRPQDRLRFELLGFDVTRIERGISHLRQCFQDLTPDKVRYHALGGTLAGLILYDITADGLYWLRTRQQVTAKAMAALRNAMDLVDNNPKLGIIPRITSFSSLTGQNYQQMKKQFDLIFPKQYFWNRGFDGLYGTVQRWVMKFSEWNPLLKEADCFLLVESLFGLSIPGVNSLRDLDRGFPPEFFHNVVASETRRALAAIEDPNKVIFWVQTGRDPHSGDAMSAYDLQRILHATKEAGAKRFLFQPRTDLSAPQWHVISRMCGNPWRENPNSYWPADTWREDVEGYGNHFRSTRKKDEVK